MLTIRPGTPLKVKNILYVTDFSPSSEVRFPLPLRWAANLARRYTRFTS